MNAIQKIKQDISPLDYYSKELVNFSAQNGGQKWIVSGLCPFHTDYHIGSFNVHRESGAYNCFSCGAKGGDILQFHIHKYGLNVSEAIKDLLGEENLTKKEHFKSVRVVSKGKNLLFIKKNINDIISCSFTLDSKQAAPARAYLENRGIGGILKDIPRDLMFNPEVLYVDQLERVYLPCLLGIVRNHDNEIITLHRTYLTKDGKKASVKDVKKLMPVACSRGMSGSAVKLYEPLNNKLGICEGIETALAARLLTGIPTWSAISSSFLSNVEFPEFVKKVIIFSDNDKSNAGQNSALKLASLLTKQGKDVKIFAPLREVREKSKDWLEVLVEQ